MTKPRLFKEYEDPNIFTAELGKTVFKGKFIVFDDGTCKVKSETHKAKFCHGQDFNRAIDGCPVAYRLMSDRNRESRFCKVIDVNDPPKRIELFGVLYLVKEKLLFTPTSGKYSNFVVTSSHEKFNKKYKENNNLPVFSCILPSETSLCKS